MTSTVAYNTKVKRIMTAKEKMASLAWPASVSMAKAALGSDSPDVPQWARPFDFISSVPKTGANTLTGNGINVRSLGLILLTVRLLIHIKETPV